VPVPPAQDRMGQGIDCRVRIEGSVCSVPLSTFSMPRLIGLKATVRPRCLALYTGVDTRVPKALNGCQEGREGCHTCSHTDTQGCTSMHPACCPCIIDNEHRSLNAHVQYTYDMHTYNTYVQECSVCMCGPVHVATKLCTCAKHSGSAE